MDKQNQELIERQKNRERGFDFGHGGTFLPDAGEINRQLFSEAIKAALCLEDDYDESLPLGEVYAGFKLKLKDKLLEIKPGQPSDSEAVWQAFSLAQAASKTTDKEKQQWGNFAESLFSTTLYEMLRSVLEAMSGGKAGDKNDMGEDGSGLAEKPSATDEPYPWPPMHGVLKAIWEAILMELALLNDQDESWKKRIKLLKNNGMARETRFWKRRLLIEDILAEAKVSEKQGLAFANDLVGLVMTNLTTPLFEVKKVGFTRGRRRSPTKDNDGADQRYCLAARPELIERIGKLSNQKRVVTQHAPLLVPPRDWDQDRGGVKSGGYYASYLPFHKFQGKNDRINSFIDACGTMDLSEVFKAVNVLQGTPWRINERVWQAVQFLLEIGMQPEPASTLATDPVQREFLARREAMIKQVLIDQERWQSRRGGLSSKRFKQPGWRLLGKHPDDYPGIPQGLLNLNLIEDLREQGSFYFAYQADTRGRLYAKAGWLSPYGDDLAKSLLEFAEAKPLTLAGVDPLAVHGSQQVGAQTLLRDLGIDGRSIPTLKDRLQWVKLREQDILDSAHNPLQHIWWMEVAKKPFQFLAFCFAWADYLEQGENALCALPVHQDGTCNGLQHIAAMTGDLALARSTNLLPDEPRDIYLEVAEEVGRVIANYAIDGHIKLRHPKFLKAHPELLGRDTAKSVVMVIPYGARDYVKSIRSALGKHMLKQAFRDSVRALCGEQDHGRFLKEVAGDLAKVFLSVVKANYPVINQFKAWLGACVEPLLERNLPVMWTVPSGFAAIQRNFEEQKGEIARSLFGEKFRLTYIRLENQVDKERQRNGILPNLIHSYDAAHLIKTVRLAAKQGIRHFSVVHDSYATHPADSGVLARCIREAFIDNYRTDPPPLQRFDAWCKALAYVHDHATEGTHSLAGSKPLTKLDCGGYPASGNELRLLELARQWGLAEKFSPRKENAGTTKAKPRAIPQKAEFDVSEVLRSVYFFS